MISRRLRLGMVGGGKGAFFGAVHRQAAAMTQRYEFIAGALSSDPARAAESGRELLLAPERSYSDFMKMADTETLRDDGIDLVAVVTPNHLHAAASGAFLAAGISVMCDKPLTATLEEALSLEKIAKNSGALLGVSYTNAGFEMVREARSIVESGALGNIRVIRAEFPQEWLATAEETAGNKQAKWRTDPAQSGAGSLGDIGTHAFHLAEFVTGQRCVSVSAEVDTFVAGRRVDDNASVQLRFSNGAKGTLWASQIAIGRTNGLRLEIYGDKASLGWGVEEANILYLCPLGKQRIVIDRASHGTSVKGHLPSGHAQGFVEALARLYVDMAECLEASLLGNPAPASANLLPGLDDGVRGMKFINAVLRSGHDDGRWTAF
ncbi:Gfo/Idh/MocA family oxidoreductase [Phyllobacterium sp. SB3]|uniref:Gfo/Idh/MocA family protein n=1 Tax=Phyllobacterium sp. SB3 TaxID=3156073 RepID=UPI0032AFFB37